MRISPLTFVRYPIAGCRGDVSQPPGPAEAVMLRALERLTTLPRPRMRQATADDVRRMGHDPEGVDLSCVFVGVDD